MQSNSKIGQNSIFVCSIWVNESNQIKIIGELIWKVKPDNSMHTETKSLRTNDRMAKKSKSLTQQKSLTLTSSSSSPSHLLIFVIIAGFFTTGGGVSSANFSVGNKNEQFHDLDKY